MSGGPYNYSYIFKYIIIGESVAGTRFRALLEMEAWPSLLSKFAMTS